MYLYNLTLQQASQITHAIAGVFAGNKQQWIATAHGKVLQLYRPDPNLGKMVPVCSVEVFGVIRSMESFRLTGGSKDYLAIGSDSGRITILEYNLELNKFHKVHQETFGKTGCRRIVPGEFLATDPKGRAVMIGAAEKQKLVYILNRDSAARLTISSPLEAHKSHTMVYDMVGVDVGFENPIFACLELDYEDIDEDTTGEALEMLTQTLTFYELDLGLNHVVRKESIPLDAFANKLIAVPGGTDGPGGVLVCADGQITWRTLGEHTPISVNIPRRKDPLRHDAATIINCFAMHRTKRMFFFLLQTEEGDIFKLTMVSDEEEVRGMIIKYFDTVPMSSAMCLLKIGLLFVASEFGNHNLYQIAQLGENEDEPSFLSTEPEDTILYFQPRSLLNLVPMECMDSLAPIMDCKVADIFQEESPQLYTLCGRGSQSTLRVLRRGLEVTEMADSELPGNPSAIWSVKKHIDDEADSYIVLSFVDATLVLGIGETVEEVKDSGFISNVPTMTAARIGDDSMLQVHPEGLRHIRADGHFNEWRAPAKTVITHCAVNERQLVLALSNSELVYFEVDRTGELNEYQERGEMTGRVTALALAPVAEGEQVARFLALGLDDQTVRMVSLDADNCLQQQALQALPGVPSDLCIIEEEGEPGEPSSLNLSIGLETGALMRTRIDSVTAELSDTRTRYLGGRPVKLFRVIVGGNHAVLALSTRPWLCYTFQSQSRTSPLSYQSLEYASAFSSEQCPEGIVAVSANTLRVLAIEKLGSVFNQNSAQLQFTGRRLLLDEARGLAIVAEGDQGCLTTIEKNKQSQAGKQQDDDGDVDMDVDMETEDEPKPTRLDAAEFGESFAGDNKWASNIRVINVRASEPETICLLQLDQDEMVTSLAKVPFRGDDEPPYVALGIVKGWKPKELTWESCSINTYVMNTETGALEFLHKTPVEGGIPSAMSAFHSRLLCGVGKSLRMFDLGKKKLLRKCENKHIPHNVMHISVLGSRIVVSDQKESFMWLKYKVQDNQLSIFCDDFNPRWATCSVILDFQTICGADKFGNIVIARLPDECTDYVEEDPTGSKSFWSRGILNGASQKMEILANFHVGETILSLSKATLTPGGIECIVYTTMGGGIGAMMPFRSKDDYEFFQNLELHLRQENPPICGREHIAFRSYYYPVRHVVDGDLCEQYSGLPQGLRTEIADALERSSAEIKRKVEDIRSRFAF